MTNSGSRPIGLDSAAAGSPRHRSGDPFIKGPVPYTWIASACRLPGSGLRVAMACRSLCCRFRSENRWGLDAIANGLRITSRSARQDARESVIGGRSVTTGWRWRSTGCNAGANPRMFRPRGRVSAAGEVFRAEQKKPVRLEPDARSGHTKNMVEKQGHENVKKVPPKCAALLLCDAVTRDDVSRKTNINGVFDTFCLESVPGSTARCTIFLRLVDMTGRFAITAEVHDKERGLVLFRSPGAGECGNPDERTSAELWLPMAPLVFDRAGAYDLVMFADEEEIARIEFQITAPSEGGF